MMEFNQLMGMYQQFKANPMALLSQQFNIPQNLTDPNAILQYLLNSGQVSQQSVNQVMLMKNNPIVQQLIGQ